MNNPADPYTFAFQPSTSVTDDAASAPAGAWLPIADAANRVGASQAALRQAIQEGRLASRREGKKILVWIEEEG